MTADTITAIKKSLEVADTLQNYTDIDAAEGANSDVVAASYAAVKTIEDLASTLESLQRENEALKEETGRLEDENSDLRYQPWPEWARAVLKVIRSGSGYDGYDDATEGVDMPEELSEHLSEMQSNVDRLAKDRYDLAYAITGGEDAPGLLDSVPTSQLVEIAANTHRSHSADIDRAIAAEAEAKRLRDSQDGLCAWLLHRFGPNTPEGREASWRMSSRAAQRSSQQTLEDTVENSLQIWFGNYDAMDEDDKATYRVPMREIVSFITVSQPEPVAVKALQEISSLGFVAAKDAPQAHDEVVKIAREALSARVQDVAGWQPASTAPRDGDEFIASCSPHFGSFSCIWDGARFVHYNHDGEYIAYPITEWMPFPAAAPAAKLEGKP